MTSPVQELYDSFIASPEWNAKLLAGDAEAKTLFNNLGARLHGIEPDAPGPDAAAMLTGPDANLKIDLYAPDAREKLPAIGWSGEGVITQREMLDHIDGLRQQGLNDTQIQELETGLDARTGKPFSPEFIDDVRSLQQERHSDPDWLRKLEAGSAWHKRQEILMNGIISHDRRRN